MLGSGSWQLALAFGDLWRRQAPERGLRLHALHKSFIAQVHVLLQRLLSKAGVFWVAVFYQGADLYIPPVFSYAVTATATMAVHAV